MPDLLNPQAATTARRPFFTAANAREYALRSHALRKLRKENQAQQQIDQQPATEITPDLRLMRVLKQIDSLDILLEGCKEPKEWDMLTRAKERLFKAWVHLLVSLFSVRGIGWKNTTAPKLKTRATFPDMEQHTKNPAAVLLGRLGGQAGRGASKARKVSTDQARKAALARWSKVKQTQV